MSAYDHQQLSGWGRYPRLPGRLVAPADTAHAVETVRQREDGHLLARGAGRSYGDAALLHAERGRTLGTRSLTRLLAFDARTGIARCEAGMTLEELATIALPRRRFLPVTPGTRYATLGGCVAADVHGKDHPSAGSLGHHVEALTLLVASGDVVTCSREEHADLFRATLGGMGLTGVVLDVTLRLRAVETAYAVSAHQRINGLRAMLRAFEEAPITWPHAVAWLDGFARGDKLGRGLLLRGRYATEADLAVLPEDARRRPFHAEPQDPVTLPPLVPTHALSAPVMWAFNKLYRRRVPKDGHRETTDLYGFFYPLDAIGWWNRVYGGKGFLQYQAVFPHEVTEEAIRHVLTRCQEARRVPFLAVLKRMGDASDGLLSFPRPGFTLALDFPRRRKLFPLLQELDTYVADVGGRVYLAKDAALSAEAFRRQYPQVEDFLAVKHRYDPDGVFTSALAERLELA